MTFRQIQPPIDPQDLDWAMENACKILQEELMKHAYRLKTVEDVRLPLSIRNEGLAYAQKHEETIYFLNRCLV